MTNCCVVGGGPAGMMLGYLLARAGVRVTVLEKHGDFLRDFRGDTVHPSTLEVMHELGLLQDFLKTPHQQYPAIGAALGNFQLRAATFRHVPTFCKFIAFMPQWDFLDFLSEHARRLPGFDLRMRHEAADLLREKGRIIGVKAKTPDGEVEIHADLVVGCDGRHSTVRRVAGMPVEEYGVPIDVLWFRLRRMQDDPEQALGNVNFGKALILINRGDYFQCGFIIRKGSFDDLKQRGLDRFRESLTQVVPFVQDRVGELHDWDQVKLLTVQINRLKRWYRPGLLCIGDAAHAMSPAGGVGINLAIQDAVAAARILALPLRERRVTEPLLASVQRRRIFPTMVTQLMQIQAHKGLKYVFDHPGPFRPPAALKTIVQTPGFQRVTGFLIGVGVRPEHVGVRPSWSARAIAAAVGFGTGVAVFRARLAVAKTDSR